MSKRQGQIKGRDSPSFGNAFRAGFADREALSGKNSPQLLCERRNLVPLESARLKSQSPNNRKNCHGQTSLAKYRRAVAEWNSSAHPKRRFRKEKMGGRGMLINNGLTRPF
jgi:hypothetical protein